ncbi:hypothetical protein PCC7424_4791 [Gloeothece citriformis PCC 7424]|uniref:Uncharacterized protein n=1 Tax=Gloeothece citriformis (strain PCC 7424) TaxID=65393 RepID=B7KD28_GLOC7|nr:hypothetical protein PCC7424_4791 [Gloeothece citriformis PCC 7424]
MTFFEGQGCFICYSLSHINEVHLHLPPALKPRTLYLIELRIAIYQDLRTRRLKNTMYGEMRRGRILQLVLLRKSYIFNKKLALFPLPHRKGEQLIN